MLFGALPLQGNEVFVSDTDLDEAAFDAVLKNATEDDEVVEEVAEEQAEESAEQTEEPTAEEPAQEPAEEPEPKAEPEPAKPAGVASKDGKAVLPYAALKGARAETKRERELRERAEAERDAMKEQLDAIKAGKTESDPLEALVEDFPAAKALVDEVKTLREQVKVKVVAPVKESDEDPIQEAIDSVPLLAEWQAADPEKWARATAIDNALRESPKWKSKPLEARFQHVARMVADEFDIQTEKDEPSPAPRVPRQDPEEVVKAAKRAPLNTLSDFKSGAATKSDNPDRLSPQKQVAMVEQMSAAAFQDWLDKQG